MQISIHHMTDHLNIKWACMNRVVRLIESTYIKVIVTWSLIFMDTFSRLNIYWRMYRAWLACFVFKQEALLVLIFNEVNKWKFMQFSVMNLSGFDFNIVSIYDWKTCIKWKQWKHYVRTFNKRNTSNNLGLNIPLKFHFKLLIFEQI
jgi:hypothetical protein